MIGRFATLIVIASASLWPAPAAASFYLSGNELYQMCVTPADDPSQLSCLSYIAGAVDETESLVPKAYCMPAGVTASQLRDIVVKFMRSDPEQRNAAAATIVFWAVANPFHCSPAK